jgi:hypothetical protein
MCADLDKGNSKQQGKRSGSSHAVHRHIDHSWSKMHIRRMDGKGNTVEGGGEAFVQLLVTD